MHRNFRYANWFEDRLLIANPKTLGEVLVTRSYEFIKPHQVRNGLGRILGIGVLLAEGDEHKQQRKNLMPAFAFRHIKDLIPVFWSKSRELVECLSKASKSTGPTAEKLSNSAQDEEKAATDEPQHAQGAIEVGDWSSRATLDIIGLCGMGQDFDALHDSDNKLNKTYRSLFSLDRASRFLEIVGVFFPFWILSRLPIKRNQQVNDGLKYIKQLCRDLIAKKRTNIAEKGKTEVDIVSVALESGGFTDEELVNQMMTSQYID